MRVAQWRTTLRRRGDAHLRQLLFPFLLVFIEAVDQVHAGFDVGLPGLVEDNDAALGNFTGLLDAPPDRVRLIFEHAITNWGDPARADVLAQKLARTQRITVLAMGSSVTAIRGGCTAPLPLVAPLCADCCGSSFYDAHVSQPGWMNAIPKAIQRLYPRVEVDIFNAGRPATGPGEYAMCPTCWFRDMDAVDVFVLEFGVSSPAAESLVRWALALPQQPLVLLVDFFEFCEGPGAGHFCRPAGTRHGDPQWPHMTMSTPPPNQANPRAVMPHYKQKVLEGIGLHYDMPVVSLRNAVVEEVRSGRMVLFELTEDGTHPSTRGSHLVGGFLDYLVTRSITAAAQRGRRGNVVVGALPAPMEANADTVNTFTSAYAFDMDWSHIVGHLRQTNPEADNSVDHVIAAEENDELHTRLLDGAGWEFPTMPTRDGWEYSQQEAESHSRHKPGMLASTAGAVLEVEVDTRPPASLQLRRHQAYVVVGYLQSYEHMGTVEVSCARGCTCRPVTIDALSSLERHSFRETQTLGNVSDGSSCILRFEVLQSTMDPSGQHKFKLFSLAVGFQSSSPPAQTEAPVQKSAAGVVPGITEYSRRMPMFQHMNMTSVSSVTVANIAFPLLALLTIFLFEGVRHLRHQAVEAAAAARDRSRDLEALALHDLPGSRREPWREEEGSKDLGLGSEEGARALLALSPARQASSTGGRSGHVMGTRDTMLHDDIFLPEGHEGAASQDTGRAAGIGARILGPSAAHPPTLSTTSATESAHNLFGRSSQGGGSRVPTAIPALPPSMLSASRSHAQ